MHAYPVHRCLGCQAVKWGRTPQRLLQASGKLAIIWSLTASLPSDPQGTSRLYGRFLFVPQSHRIYQLMSSRFPWTNINECICILHLFSTSERRRSLIFTAKEDKNISNVYIQYVGLWWLGDAWGQGISSRDTGQRLLSAPSGLSKCMYARDGNP